MRRMARLTLQEEMPEHRALLICLVAQLALPVELTLPEQA